MYYRPSHRALMDKCNVYCPPISTIPVEADMRTAQWVSIWDIDNAIGRKRVSKNIAVMERHEDMSDLEIGALFAA